MKKNLKLKNCTFHTGIFQCSSDKLPLSTPRRDEPFFLSAVSTPFQFSCNLLICFMETSKNSLHLFYSPLTKGDQGGCVNRKISLWKCPYVILEKIRCVFIFNATRIVKKHRIYLYRWLLQGEPGSRRLRVYFKI